MLARKRAFLVQNSEKITSFDEQAKEGRIAMVIRISSVIFVPVVVERTPYLVVLLFNSTWLGFEQGEVQMADDFFRE